MINIDFKYMDNSPEHPDFEVAIIGLGYVGLPLFCCFSGIYQTWGLDIDRKRIDKLKEGLDSNLTVPPELLSTINSSLLTSEYDDLKNCRLFIVTAPTPVDIDSRPDISILKGICRKLGGVINRGAIIIFESTVSPGTTEEICVPIIESSSGLRLNKDFYVGYSPERINIGDNEHSIRTVPKIVSASDGKILDFIAEAYEKALLCPIIKASSIKVAEAAKLYENVQRDVLISLANQYSEYCRAEGIDIREVTACASTKWNFANVLPGLVGGHCIGVDPYYLIHRSAELGVGLPLVETARSINEQMALKVAHRIIHEVKSLDSAKVLLLGASYKPNTCDTRNSKVFDILDILTETLNNIWLYDPYIELSTLNNKYRQFFISQQESETNWDLVVQLVNHKEFAAFKLYNTTKFLTLEDLI